MQTIINFYNQNHLQRELIDTKVNFMGFNGRKRVRFGRNATEGEIILTTRFVVSFFKKKNK